MSEGMEHAAELGRFRPYPEYKDSGVEWLGAVPIGWGVTRVSDEATVINGYPFDSERFSADRGWPLVRIRDLDSETTEVFYDGPDVEAARVQRGDILIGMDGDFNVSCWRGNDALLNQRMCCLRALQGFDGQYLRYSVPFPLGVINELTHSTTVKHLSSSQIKKTKIAHPPSDEQRAIAEFLDRETGKIDALVAKKERLIELLQEKRTALITHAVTKGLDPTTRLKDANANLLGQIPTAWGEMRLRQACTEIFLGLTSRVDYVDEPGFPLVRALNISTGVLDLSDVRHISEDQHRQLTKYRRAMRGDILVSKSGSIGVTAVVNTDEEFSIYESLFCLRPKEGALTSGFLLFAMRGAALQEQYRSKMVGMGVDHINMSDILDVWIPLPPLDEQQRIVRHLEREVVRIDALASKVVEARSKLKEFRTALISAAVTGKIDVREQAA